MICAAAYGFRRGVRLMPLRACGGFLSVSPMGLLARAADVARVFFNAGRGSECFPERHTGGPWRAECVAPVFLGCIQSHRVGVI